ncbi:GNAT family N-acetyltransferase [Dactylosporangium sp. AC04546]|uniref:GNAT family N-acetyltransferase n=1 Tax=Dactylosporangium sp. AC04546 TaxID=2862460 RepID=UPI001EDD07DF|nr:GNAT family N-acetyltransferase [Dactylosporangium sp. AC04546]WVK87928.1 GNAT family N-acetyltransferase [Dactylosporangium sp. AC04546]
MRIERYEGPRDAVRWLFELADDSAALLDGYLGEGVVLLVRDGGELVGHAQLVGDELTNMAVVAGRRGQGVGAALVAAVVELARAEGVRTLRVGTGAADVGNLRFYQRQGFRMRSIERDVFIPANGYPEGIFVDGIELRDRVWLDREL